MLLDDLKAHREWTQKKFGSVDFPRDPNCKRCTNGLNKNRAGSNSTIHEFKNCRKTLEKKSGELLIAMKQKRAAGKRRKRQAQN